jgi:hypothetical protein
MHSFARGHVGTGMLNSGSWAALLTLTRITGFISFQDDPTDQALSCQHPNQYFRVNSGRVNASHSLSDVVRM